MLWRNIKVYAFGYAQDYPTNAQKSHNNRVDIVFIESELYRYIHLDVTCCYTVMRANRLRV